MKLLNIRQLLVYAAFCIVGVFNAFNPTIMSGFKSMQTDPGDTRLNHYFLEHSFQIVSNQNYISELFSPSFFYPYKNILAFSDNLFGSAPIYWALRVFFTADFSYQLWMIVVCVLCFVSFAILMHHYRVSNVVSVVGSFIFAFGIPRIAQIGHQQLLPQFFTPLAFLFAWEFIKCPKNKQLALTLLFVYLQVLAGIYLGWFLIFSLGILSLIVWILELDIRYRLIKYFKNNYKAVLIIFASWSILMFALLAPYIEAKKVIGDRSYTEVDGMLPRFSSWFSTIAGSLWWSVLSGNTKDLPAAHEHILFSGFLLILLTGLSVYTLLFRKDILSPDRKMIIVVCLLVSCTIFILSLRLPNGWSLWRIIYQFIPGATVIRVVTRIWTVVYFYLLVAVMLSLDCILNRVTLRYWRKIALSLLCSICILEQIVTNPPSFEILPFTKDIMASQSLMKKGCDLAYVMLDTKNPHYQSQLSAMWAGIKANIPVINGYSGSNPPNYVDSTKSMNIFEILHWLGEDQKGRLCLISKYALPEKNQLISLYAATQTTSPQKDWNSYQINLPIQKIFSQYIKVFDISKSIPKNTLFQIPVLIKNTSNFIWFNQGKNSVNFSYHWLDANGKLAILDGERTSLPFDLSPGATAAINPVIKTPPQPGKYNLVLTMVQESVAWFSDKQAQSPKIDVTITSDS